MEDVVVIKIYAKRIREFTGVKIKTRGHYERYTCHGGMWAAENGLLLYSDHFEEPSQQAIDIIKEFAEARNNDLDEDNDIEIQILDIMENVPAVRSLFDSIKTIPTVVIGKEKITGVPTIRDLEKAFLNN
ncbi:MAG: hypothetical protein KAS67_01540 [Thermoplasmata archaeon]|nr:hypothetical protein [Thermoplasmata archaeon]